MHLISGLAPLLLATAAFAKPVELNKRAVATSTACSYTSILPSPTPLICGKEGDITRDDSTIMTWEAGTSSNKCLSYCKDTTECISYSWNSQANICIYYNAAIKASNFSNTVDTDTYFWNKRCFGRQCSTTTVTLPSSTSSAKTSIKPLDSTVKATISATSIRSSLSIKTSPLSSSSIKTSTLSSSSIKTSTRSSSSIKTSATTLSTAKPSSTIKTSLTAKTSSTVKTTSSVRTSSKPSTTIKPTSTKPTTTQAPANPTPTTCRVPDLSIDTCSSLSVNLANLVKVSFNAYYTGTETIETPLSDSKKVRIANVDTLCNAAKSCANQATLLGLVGLYSSFDVHYLKESCEFECVLNKDANTDAGLFNVTAPQVGAAVGFSATVTVGL